MMGNQRQYKQLPIVLPVLYLVSLLVACAPATRQIEVKPSATVTQAATGHPTQTPHPTRTPTLMPIALLTPTAIPTFSTASLITRTWDAKPMLVAFGPFGTSPAPYGVSNPPDLILYSNGQLIIHDNFELWERHLMRQDMCRLLNTIDLIGFFDMDLSDYFRDLQKEYGESSLTVVEVNAWRSRKEKLDIILDAPQINAPDALHAIYQLLSSYKPDNLRPYKSNQLAISIYKFPAQYPYVATRTWALTAPSLKEIFKQARAKSRQEAMGLLLEGDSATKVYEELGVASSLSE
jgi:hypothetical protein